ncbi:hypothetical protein O3G_MSEX012500 [Manduca sexta]|uniref:MCMDC2 N-terminal domain-containing protein n=1 Tax=Manduca sexta TaxID=7130 RepID=A0A921ZPX5_MANSE|nr:hypothetical protein O3G_MSEX012500 [Manduca sexta]
MDLLCQILIYLDWRHNITDMKNECTKFLEQMTNATMNKFPPLRCILEIDVMDLIAVLPDVGVFLLQEPLKFQMICNEILYACMLSIDNPYKKNIANSQVGVTIRLRCVPRLLIPPNPRLYQGVTLFEGLLMAISKPESYVFHTVWSCPEECDGNEVIYRYIPKFPPKCCICRSVLYENCGLKRCGEQVTVSVKLKNDFICKKFLIFDDLISKLKLGATYSFHVVVVKKKMIIWSMEPLVPLIAPMTCSVSRDIGELYEACGGLPWKLIYCLASTIGVNKCPLNCFMSLKITLLLSLTSVKANVLTGSSIINVVAANMDTSFVGDIMVMAANLADRSICISTHNTSMSSALIAGSGGICMLPLPLHIYNHKEMSSLFSALETGEICTDTGKTKIQCAVWAHGMDLKKGALHDIISVFGTVCRGDYGEHHEHLVDFMLQRAVESSESTKEEKEALKDIQNYIDLVAGINVALNKDTEILLRSYFLAARKERPRGVSVACMAGLVAASLTSARLCRRNLTNVDDAVFAIWLHVTGCPEPRYAPDEYLDTPRNLKTLETLMNNFKEWLNQFIER